MAELVKDLEQEEKFSPYPEQVDKYFKDNIVTIQTFPDEISDVAEFEFPAIHITSAKQYVDYLDGEIEFWKSHDVDQKLKSIAQYGNLIIAKQEFESAIKSITSSYSFQNSLNTSISRARKGALHSKTKLTQVLLKHIDRSKYFFDGFRYGILTSKTTSMSPLYADTYEGFLAALAYRETYKQYIAYSEDTIKEFQKNAEKASQNYADLNQSYVAAFHEQQQRIEQITKQTNEHLTELDQKSVKQYADADTRLVNMEKTYREKLRLEAPAEYWRKLKRNYSIKGYIWFFISGLCAASIIVLLLTALVKDMIFSPGSSWAENLKNSAIVTVITSIGIYVLRLTTKMALSSLHLADDARERENLSYFYLSLIEKGAVTDKERALVLNSLFSRSDTGLLKGDAAPSMPSNVADIIDIIKKTQG